MHGTSLMFRFILQPFYTCYVLISFLISLAVCFPFFLILGMQRNKKARRVIWAVTHYWSVGWLWCIGMPLRRKGIFPRAGRYVVIANHISYLDTINIYAAVPEFFRTLAKKEMAHFPVFGFVYKQLTVLVDRSNAESRARSMRLMWRLLKHESHIAVFPEGGFNETGALLKPFYDGAFRLAVQTGTDIVPILFLDTVNRWHFSAWWRLKPGKNRVLFLPPISVSPYDMEDLPRLKQHVFSVMEQELEKYRGLSGAYPVNKKGKSIRQR